MPLLSLFIKNVQFQTNLVRILYPVSHENDLKTIPFGDSHTHIASTMSRNNIDCILFSLNCVLTSQCQASIAIFVYDTTIVLYS